MDFRVVMLVSVLFALFNVPGALAGSASSIVCLGICVALIVYSLRNIDGR